MVLVFIGTFAVGAAGMSLPDWLYSIKQVKNAFLGAIPKGEDLVASIVSCAETARREGLLALESRVSEIDEPMLRRGLELAIDGTDPEALGEILDAEVSAAHRRGLLAPKLFENMGGYAPTIGIIGTVIGLVQVLGNLSEPSELGHMIASAFIATLWGVLTANVMWLPIGNKLKMLSELEHQRRELIVEGVLAIQSGANPRVVDRKLRAYLPQSEAPVAKAA
jgi:chemotaxis protein MotA